ncbi:Metallo-beta-lactamase-like protein 2 [Elsinoe fawcettii]|nr:Metallo-beta-lactamase-like protein 2 [Elsinoe fawcettii]
MADNLREHVQVQILDGGRFYGDLGRTHVGTPIGTRSWFYSWVFYIYHPTSKTHILWDVGLSEDESEYTKFTASHTVKELNAKSPRLSLVEQLSKRGIAAEDISTVIFSHHHWDHSRPIRSLFPNATGYFGPGTWNHCAPGLFHDDPYDPLGKGDANFFHPTKATERCKELTGPWTSYGPFDRAMDYFCDGSLQVLEAPGHMPGNLAAVLRLRGGHRIVLGGDCCHSREIMDGQQDFATWYTGDGRLCSLHEDISAAKATVDKLRMLEQEGAHIALAHDVEWMLRKDDAVLMSLLSADMHDFVHYRLAGGGIP